MADPVKGYEFFEHTADVGIAARGVTLAELFEQAARGLVELLAENSVLEPRQAWPVVLSAENVELLLLAWLQELLFWFSTEGFLPVRYALDELTETSLRGQVSGDVFDPTRHVQGREVKAITRHLLNVEQRDGMWHGQVIVDI